MTFEPLEERMLMSVVTLTDQEQLLLELTNRARENPSAEAARYGISLNQGLSAGTISSDAKPPLIADRLLRDAARDHSQDMIDRDFFDHVNPDGESPGDRVRAAGYDYYAGENISWRGSTGSINQTQTVYAQHEGLFKSPGHRKGILKDSSVEIGTGVRYGQLTQDGETYNSCVVTENFGYGNSQRYITGVAFDESVETNDFYDVGEGLGGITIQARRSDGNVYTTTTAAAGGYQLAVPNGTYTVTATGSGFGTHVLENVRVQGENVKVDFTTTTGGVGQDSFATAAYLLGPAYPNLSMAAEGQFFYLAHDADVDFYRIEAVAGNRLEFGTVRPLDREYLDTYVRLFNSRGEELASDDDSGSLSLSQLEYTFTRAGYYYVGVSGAPNNDYDPLVRNSGSDGDMGWYGYSAKLRHETGLWLTDGTVTSPDANDTLSRAKDTEIAPEGGDFSREEGVVYFDLELSTPRDVDIYRFEGYKDNRVEIRTMPSSGGRDVDTYVRLYDASGEQIGYNDDGGEGYYSYLETTLPHSGLYYFAVTSYRNRYFDPNEAYSGSADPDSDPTGDYDLSVGLIITDVVGDSLAEARNTGLSGEGSFLFDSALESRSDVDMYRFQADAGSTLLAETSIDVYGYRCGDTYLRLFDANGIEIGRNDDGGEGLYSRLEHTFAASGTYYLGVSNYPNHDYNPISGTVSQSGNADCSYGISIVVTPGQDHTVGVDKVGVYSAGPWLLDANGNQRWDGTGSSDANFRMGWNGTTPVVGNFNSDNLDEVGVYSSGAWLLDANGNQRWDGTGSSDACFRFGWDGAIPVVGDWNGDGRDEVGVYSDGAWLLDVNGNHRWDGVGSADACFRFGWNGAIPVVGDWNGDDVDEVGIYSGGAWLLDANGNQRWDGQGSSDANFRMGWNGATPVVGDWNGDNVDEVGVYSGGAWLLDANANQRWDGTGSSDACFRFGWNGAIPVVGNWRGISGPPPAAAGSESLNRNAPTLADPKLHPVAEESLARKETVAIDSALRELVLRGCEGRQRVVDPKAVDRIDLLTVASLELDFILGPEDFDPLAENLLSNDLRTGLRSCLAGADVFGARV